MDDFKIVIDGKECYIELDNSAARSDINCAELKRLVKSYNIPKESISYTMHIKKNTKNYNRMQELLETLKLEAMT